MLSFLKKIFGARPAAESPAPYKVEGTEHFPFPKAEPAKAPAVKKPTAKKPAAKKAKKSKE